MTAAAGALPHAVARAADGTARPGDARPRLRRDLRFVCHENDGTVSWVVKDPLTLKYFRFGQIEAWLMQQMDGSSTLEQICDELHRQTGMRAKPAALDVLVRRLKELGLMQRTLAERSALLLEQIRSQRRLKRSSHNTLLRTRVSFGDPDRLLQRGVELLGFMWTRGFVIASLLLFALYGVLLAWFWSPFVNGAAQLMAPAASTLLLVVTTYVMFSVIGIVHELGHGLTCKRFGGEVHEIGVMLLYFLPGFYCNVSDAWTFDKRSHRLWVSFAGGWIELWLAGIGVIVWLLTEPGTFVNTVALVTAILAGAQSLLLNYNPLIPLDGYYALSDWLEMSNLRQRSMQYLGAVFRARVLRVSADVPRVTDRERRIFLRFGIAAVVYTGLLFTVIAWLALLFATRRFGAWGFVLFLSILYFVTKGPRRTLVRVARQWLSERRPTSPGRRRSTTFAAGAVLLLVGVAAFMPWTVRATGTVTVEPAVRRLLQPQQEALLLDVRAADGERVAAGAVIVVLRNPELELRRAEAALAAQEFASRAAGARARGAAGEARLADVALESARRRLESLDRERAALLLRAPFAGTVVAPLLHERIGERIHAGTTLVEVWSDAPPVARVQVPHRAGGEVTAGAAVRIRFPAHSWLTWRTRIAHIETESQADRFDAIALLPRAPDRPLVPGMTGRARIDVRRTTVAGAVLRSARRILRQDLLL